MIGSRHFITTTIGFLISMVQFNRVPIFSNRRIASFIRWPAQFAIRNFFPERPSPLIPSFGPLLPLPPPSQFIGFKQLSAQSPTEGESQPVIAPTAAPTALHCKTQRPYA